MPLKTKVKVGNITNLSEARYCAGMGVDILSFPIGTDPGSISIEKFSEIADWVIGPEFALELEENIDEETFKKITRIPFVQHIQLKPGQLKALSRSNTDKSFILFINDDTIDTLDLTNLNQLAYVIIDQVDLDWEVIQSTNKKVPVLIDFANGTHDLSKVLCKSVTGIALHGSEELAAGNKSYDHLADILELLETD